MKQFRAALLERLKSPVLWSTVIIVAQDRLSILEQTGFSPRNIAVGIVMICLTALSALNNPADRDRL